MSNSTRDNPLTPRKNDKSPSDRDDIKEGLIKEGYSILSYSPDEVKKAIKAESVAKEQKEPASKSSESTKQELDKREKAPEQPKTEVKKTTDKSAETKSEFYTQSKTERRTNVSEAEKKDGIAYSYDAQYKGANLETKYGFNEAGQFVRFDNGLNVYRKLSADNLKEMNLTGQAGWYQMDGKDPTKPKYKLAYEDLNFLPSDGKGNGSMFVARHAEDKAYVWEQTKDGTVVHEGKINASHAFVKTDQSGSPTWILRPDGSQVKAEYAYNQQVAGRKPPLSSFTERNANGEELTFKQDILAKNKYVSTDRTGKVEERFNTTIEGSTIYSDDKLGVSTIVLGNSTVEHGHILFGDANTALNYRAHRKQPNVVHLEPATYPTFCIDSQGRASGILAPEKGGRPGCNDGPTPEGGTDRLFAYVGNTDKLYDVSEINSKGQYADRIYRTTRNVDANRNWTDTWTVQLPTMVDALTNERNEEGRPKTEKQPGYIPFSYTGPMQFEPGSLALRWDDPVGQAGNQFKVACINNPDGSVERMHKLDYREGGKPDGKILYSINRYLDKDLKVTGIQHVDANGSRGDKITSGAGVTFDAGGKITYLDKENNEHHIHPDQQEAILNSSDWTYVQKDSSGRIIRAGQRDQSGKMDEGNCLKFEYPVASDGSQQVAAYEVVNGISEKDSTGKEKPFFIGPGKVRPNGELWYDVQKDPETQLATVTIKRPDLSTLHKKLDATNTLIDVSADNAQFDTFRQVTQGKDPSQPDNIVDIVKDKNSGVTFVREFVGIDPDKAVDNGLPLMLQDGTPMLMRQYYMTLREVQPGKELGKDTPYTIPPPLKPGETPKPNRGQPKVFTALEVLSNGDLNATDLMSGQLIALATPRSSAELRKDYVMPDHVHLARAQERFEKTIQTVVNLQTQSNPQNNQPSSVWSRYDHLTVNSTSTESSTIKTQAANYMQSHAIPLVRTIDGAGRPLSRTAIAAQYDYATARILADRTQAQPWAARLPQLQAQALKKLEALQLAAQEAAQPVRQRVQPRTVSTAELPASDDSDDVLKTPWIRRLLESTGTN